MINGVTLKANVDKYILSALQEDITSEDVTTNAIMPYDMMGEVSAILSEDNKTLILPVIVPNNSPFVIVCPSIFLMSNLTFSSTMVKWQKPLQWQKNMHHL